MPSCARSRLEEWLPSDRDIHCSPPHWFMRLTFGSEARRVFGLKTGRTSLLPPRKPCAGSSWIHARRGSQLKRGGAQIRVELDEAQITVPVEDEKLLAVNEALEVLAREDPVKAEVVKMRYFIGLKHGEIAEALGMSAATVRRHWAVARFRLFDLISPSPDGDGTRIAE